MKNNLYCYFTCSRHGTYRGNKNNTKKNIECPAKLHLKYVAAKLIDFY